MWFGWSTTLEDSDGENWPPPPWPITRAGVRFLGTEDRGLASSSGAAYTAWRNYDWERVKLAYLAQFVSLLHKHGESAYHVLWPELLKVAQVADSLPEDVLSQRMLDRLAEMRRDRP